MTLQQLKYADAVATCGSISEVPGYVDSDCFECESPVVVSARTFLSQRF